MNHHVHLRLLLQYLAGMDDDRILRIIVGDLLISELKPATTWSPLFIATASLLTGMLRGELHEFGVAYNSIRNRVDGIPEPIRTRIFLDRLSEVLGVQFPVNEEQMHDFVRCRVPAFAAERTEFGRVELREIMIGNGKIVE